MSRPSLGLLVPTLLSLVSLASGLAGSAAAQTTTIGSLSSSGGQGNDASLHQSALSSDGRWLAFQSDASNLVAGDGNGERDNFLRDRQAGTTVRVSVATGGAQANGSSYAPVLSGDGRFVAFESDASNLVAGDSNGLRDVFLRDTLAGVTSRVSVSSLGAQANSLATMAAISGDGSVLAFASGASTLVSGVSPPGWQIFVHERLTGVTTLGSVALAGGPTDNVCYNPSLSADGRVVAFQSAATNLVPGDTNGLTDIFAHELLTGATTRVSVSSAGAQGNGGSDGTSQVPALSADGRYVAFRSIATNLAPNTIGWNAILLRDRLAGTTISLCLTPGGAAASGDAHHPAMSADGRFVAFQSAASDLVSSDTNGVWDIFVRGALPVTWLNLGSALAGVAGLPALKGSGTLAPGSSCSLALSQARPLASAMLFVSASSTPAPFKGGTLVPVPALLTLPLVTSAGGTLGLPFTWPAGIPSGSSFYFQMAIVDPAAVAGVALSNALEGTTP